MNLSSYHVCEMKYNDRSKFQKGPRESFESSYRYGKKIAGFPEKFRRKNEYLIKNIKIQSIWLQGLKLSMILL